MRKHRFSLSFPEFMVKFETYSRGGSRGSHAILAICCVWQCQPGYYKLLESVFKFHDFSLFSLDKISADFELLLAKNEHFPIEHDWRSVSRREFRLPGATTIRNLRGEFLWENRQNGPNLRLRKTADTTHCNYDPPIKLNLVTQLSEEPEAMYW